MVVIFDLDGTLALINKRRSISTKDNQKLDWNVFFDPKNIDLDLPNKTVIAALNSLKKSGYSIYIMSGRLSTTREATIRWLKKHCIHYDSLMMRENSSEEKLSIIDFAKSDGFCLYNLENFKAILVVKSPFSSKSSETSISSIDILILASTLLRQSFKESLI